MNINHTDIKQKNIDEQQLLYDIKSGHQEEFEYIIRHYNSMLYSIGKVYQYKHSVITDIMRNTYFDIYKQIKSQTIKNIKTDLIKKMINDCMRQFNTNNNIISNYNMDTKNKTFNEVIEEALSSIPLDYRLVYTLLEINKLDLKEVSEIINETETKIIENLKLAKIYLQDKINELIAPTTLFEFNLIYCDAMVDSVMDKINHE